MDDYRILFYGSLSGCLSEVGGNLSNFWSYIGHYHSANPFLCSRGIFHDWDQKKRFLQQSLINDLYSKRLLKKLQNDVKWNSIAWGLRFYIKENLNIKIKKESSNFNQSFRYLKYKQNQFLYSFVFGSIAQLFCSSLFQIRNLFKSEQFFSFQSFSIRLIQFGALFGTYDMVKIIMKNKEQQKFFIIQTYLAAQFSSLIACFTDSLFYFFINKSSRFYFFYGERILVSKNGLALFLFDQLSSKDGIA
ncbi:unnamed protein product [Paramecium sonneborni]|uniref:Transmembrane protein n=1 Tax=Paramecium sonneborni TaxID=65129 RepID=A0A8S1RQW9_9CILI|nr:unnamed protein product [Paramecium sonneborni]